MQIWNRIKTNSFNFPIQKLILKSAGNSERRDKYHWHKLLPIVNEPTPTITETCALLKYGYNWIVVGSIHHRTAATIARHGRCGRNDREWERVESHWLYESEAEYESESEAPHLQHKIESKMNGWW